ncbi:MAG: carbohydrate binding family 9 domain-containing protein, partial [Acidobacteriota bacterium]|nr:carbohydrate binding family 9 domain-containing protein [Acidobacteriota bacterium]
MKLLYALILVAVTFLSFAAGGAAFAQEQRYELNQIRSVNIPKVSRPPKFEDFITGAPREAELVITDFRQVDPGDGDPVSQPTTAYLSYDEKNLYAAFVAKDDPSKIRATISRRDSIFSNDRVTLSLDTFHDHQRNYWFESNAYGVQMDGTNNNGIDDLNFDTLWYSEARIVEDGYVVLMTIPFKSLRFPNTPVQNWGIMVSRAIQRNNEWANWPYLTWRLMPSWQGQFGDLTGIRDISPGRNMQFIPYAGFSRASYWNPLKPGLQYDAENDFRAGLDAKMVLRDSLTLDMTLNPDFSQVESDSPQVT